MAFLLFYFPGNLIHLHTIYINIVIKCNISIFKRLTVIF